MEMLHCVQHDTPNVILSEAKNLIRMYKGDASLRSA